MTKKETIETLLSLSSLSDEERYQRGSRIKFIRKSLRYSVYTLGEKYNIASSTLNSWEQGRFTGLTKEGALKLVNAFQEEGVHCTFDWLYHGIGPAPMIPTRMTAFPDPTNLTDVGALTQELQLFYQLHPQATHLIVNDESMEPFFSRGDHVAGIRRYAKDMNRLEAKHCIVQATTGQILVRQLYKSTKAEYFDLYATNSNLPENERWMNNVCLFSAASIIWIRKPELY